MSHEMPNFGQPKKPIGDEQLRARERAAEADSGEVAAEEKRFVELMRAGNAGDQEAQQRLFAVLSKANGADAAVLRMNTLLEPAKMRGAVVNVESPAGAGPAPDPERRWVSWKRVWRLRASESIAKMQGRDPEELVEIPGSIEKILRVTLRNAPLEDLIGEGQYNLENARINSNNFSIEAGEGPQTIDLIQFDRTVNTKEVLLWLEANDYLGATLKSLLAIGAQFPEEQRRVYMAALGQVWKSDSSIVEYVPDIYADGHERGLGLGDNTSRSTIYARFPAVRKPTSRVEVL